MHCCPPARLLPRLMPMDVPEHESLRLGAEERTGGELVIESRHRHAVFGHAAEHRAVRHADGRHACARARRDDRRKAAQQVRQLLAHRLRGLRWHRPPRPQPPCSPSARRRTAPAQSGGTARSASPAMRSTRPCAVSATCWIRSATCTGCRPPSSRNTSSVPGGSCENVPCSISTGQWSASRRTCASSRTAAGACTSKRVIGGVPRDHRAVHPAARWPDRWQRRSSDRPRPASRRRSAGRKSARRGS